LVNVRVRKRPSTPPRREQKDPCPAGHLRPGVALLHVAVGEASTPKSEMKISPVLAGG
jgi:hypothetical protein